MPTIETQNFGTLHLGKRDARPPSGDHVQMSDVLNMLTTLLPPIPQHFGHGLDFGRYGWKMLGNGPQDDNSIPTSWAAAAGCGNCDWAGPAHEEMEAARNAGRPIPHFSGLTVVKQYAAYSGYDPQTGANDNGSDMQEVLTWRQTKGLLDDAGHSYKIGKTVALVPGDMHQLWAATYLFECVGIGVRFTEAQQKQFDAGQPWDYVAGSQDLGGHYVPVMGDNGLISWAQRVAFTPAFIQQQCEEAYAYVDPLRYSAVTGRDAEGHADQDIEMYVNLIAQAR